MSPRPCVIEENPYEHEYDYSYPPFPTTYVISLKELILTAQNQLLSLSERQYLYFLQSTEVIGNITIARLREHFGCYEAIYKADIKELSRLLSDKMLERFVADRSSKDIEYEFDRIKKNNIRYCAQGDPDYPSKLLELHDAPPAILVNGSLPDPHIPSVAIIGARNCSNYGKSCTQDFTDCLSESGIQIISGMAMGIDGIAGRTALRSNGRSFAVLGSGPDVCYPASNRDLFDGLKTTGGIISEYQLGSPGVGWHFPMRNRLIAALADVLLVIEAKGKSGTMITVDFALELGRDVYALPGRISDIMSQGCNLLIKQGAQILTSPEDFVSDFLTNCTGEERYISFFNSLSDTSTLKKAGPLFNSPEEKLVFKCLSHTPLAIDDILESVNKQIPMTISQLMIILTNLSISGYVVSIAGNNYAWR